MMHNALQYTENTRGIYRETEQGIGNKLGWLAKNQPDLKKLVEKATGTPTGKRHFHFIENSVPCISLLEACSKGF